MNSESSYSAKYTFDRTAFSQLSAEEADQEMRRPRAERTVQERLEYSYYLTARAYGFDPDNPPRMDKTHFEWIKREP
jgi:hypothetical protein